MTNDATIEANRLLGREFFGAQDRRRGGPAETLCAPNYRAYLGSNPPMDRAGHDGFARAFYGAFEGMRHEVEEVVATDDRVVVRFTLRGRHTGDFFGVPATDHTIAVPANVILHVAAGKVTELLGVFDEGGMLRQLGVLPSGQ